PGSLGRQEPGIQLYDCPVVIMSFKLILHSKTHDCLISLRAVADIESKTFSSGFMENLHGLVFGYSDSSFFNVPGELVNSGF
ncbi:MAG: hypothetical protein U9Q07_12490, partial [Planctomycetota bacterium]|nr:hypothetical protein [Planctomycetota bacterium]